jgi:hypothetical protein
MGEFDNAGFPLSYCLLSTATAIDQGKRTKALAGWAQCVRDKYGLNPVFIHTDKDMAEIGCSKMVWDAKINLCWWHLRRAVRVRLAKGKLSTSPYNVDRAMKEFGFIDANFIPPGTQIDIEDCEGGSPDDVVLPLVNAETSSSSTNPPTMSLPNPPANQPPAIHPPILGQPLGDASNALRIKFSLPSIVSAVGRVIQGAGFKLHIAPKQLLPDIEEEEPKPMEDEGSISEEDDDSDGPSRRTFCPVVYREPIINMMERHYCAHPSIPGYGPPDAVGIKKWAVRQSYNFCHKNKLPEVWAYLWENWYRKGRWELWARCAHKLIPVLKTTMILESQYVSNTWYFIYFTDLFTAGDASNTTFCIISTCRAVTY